VGAALKLVDQNSSRETLHEFTLQLVSERVTARQIVQERVRHEVASFNQQKSDNVFRGLIQPTGTERALNGFRLKQPRTIDVAAQLDHALAAFDRNGFLMLVDDRQVETLDEEIVVTPSTVVTFIKLVPLVGG
jgi:hypothetical protein